MMLKVILYAYCYKTYSCRKIALALRRDVAFLWLAQTQQPDFKTINRFRGEYFKEVVPKVFAEVVTDAGYGSEQNYVELEAQGVEAYLKLPDFNRDVKDGHSSFHPSGFVYNQAMNSVTCPEGRSLSFQHSEERKQHSGFQSQVEVYECQSCAGCPFHAVCVRGPGNRRIHYNRRLQAQRRQAMERLTSPEGVALCRQRGNACERLFGDLKHNQGVGRYRLRGLPKVRLEALLWSIRFNL